MTLSADSLTARYGSLPPVLENVSVTVEPGRVTALIGPNAGGKSTLLRCLARAHPPASGRVSIGPDDLYRLPAREAARRIAYVPQDNPMPFAFTVAELIMLGADAAPVGDHADRSRRISEAVALFDLEPLAERSLLTLSGGERQRAALARAFAQNTPFLLLDEPTLHLDLRHQAALLRAVRTAAREKGQAVLLVLHDINQAAAAADTLLLLHGGRIAASGEPATVLSAERLSEAYQTSVLIRDDLATGKPHVTLPLCEDSADAAR